MPLSAAAGSDLVVVQASIVTTSGTAATGTAVPIYGIRIGVNFVLDVTSAATAAGDTLDVFVQAQIEGTQASPTYLDIVHFTQVLGNGGAKRFIAKVGGAVSETMYDCSTALAAGSVKTFMGDYYRVKYSVVSASAPSFTWSVTALPF